MIEDLICAFAIGFGIGFYIAGEILLKKVKKILDAR